MLSSSVCQNGPYLCPGAFNHHSSYSLTHFLPLENLTNVIIEQDFSSVNWKRFTKDSWLDILFWKKIMFFSMHSLILHLLFLLRGCRWKTFVAYSEAKMTLVFVYELNLQKFISWSVRSGCFRLMVNWKGNRENNRREV